MPERQRLKINRLGAQGDGIAEYNGEPVFVPFTLPGETVDVAVEGERGRLISITEPSAERVEPVCIHFGRCGGCALQHFNAESYSAWKCGLIRSALSMRGIEADLEPLVSVGLGSRRRAVLTARRDGAVVQLGFHEAGSRSLVDIRVCPVLAPEIVDVLPGLRELVRPLLGARSELRLHVLRADNGLDVDVSGFDANPSPGARAGLAKAASELQLVRFSLDRDPLYQSGAPVVTVGPAQIVPPPGAFLQASAVAEAAIAERAVAAFGKRARQAADLFCGVGAFSFALAARAKVLAVDNEQAALEALEQAKRRTQGVRAIETRLRDLFQEPLSRKELDAFDLVLFDPPRAGAKDQASMLAKSKVPVVVAVSCNPATLARDLRIMIDGGYRLERVTPIDQFLFTHHVEVVAVLRR